VRGPLNWGRSVETLARINAARRDQPIGLDAYPYLAGSTVLRSDLRYDSSLMADVDCYELLEAGVPSGLVELPVEWIRDDGAYLIMNRFEAIRPYTSPADVYEIFRREFDAAYAEGGIFQLTMHPHVTGYRSRIWILEEIIRHAQSHPKVWFATHRDVAQWALEHAQ
jgi:peptidoglycan-N-acetylglucosamine deacetylase